MARIGILGVGAVGARLARQLVSTDDDDVVLRDERRNRVELVANSLGDRAIIDRGSLDDLLDVDVVVLPVLLEPKHMLLNSLFVAAFMSSAQAMI